VSVLFGSGGETFAPKVALAANVISAEIVAADLNGDGHLDLARHLRSVTRRAARNQLEPGARRN
jgi:hypothetical protein